MAFRLTGTAVARCGRRVGFDDVTAANGVDMPRWVCEDPHRSRVIFPMVTGMRRENFLGKMNEELPKTKSRFTEAQIMDVPRQAEGSMPVPELCREHGISRATFYQWRVKCGAMNAFIYVLFRLY